ncbi:Ion transport protein-domain-containing protein [Zychaea mexicana]|uniref:Ion transport protein-domain-containing protein n=1 Tax=Zychaea mexicana TaxID=64656 RepID=UPI0022FEC929|nr:Ion transport protein-domain-containing protein [Zychaea mexicana]KAI9498171.1 Ion transport protein-domain-containing protein [Zychaea mexicana]
MYNIETLVKQVLEPFRASGGAFQISKHGKVRQAPYFRSQEVHLQRIYNLMSLSTNRQEQSAPGGSRLSSNNPYRDLEARGELDPHQGTDSAFLTFTPKEHNVNNGSSSGSSSNGHNSILRRKNTVTITTKPVPVEEFEAAFEERPVVQRQQEQQQQDYSPPAFVHRRPSRAESIASSSLLAGQAPIPSYDAIEEPDYSDTARLTANVGDEPAADQPADRPVRRNQSMRKVATVLRKVSRRVVNIQNDDNAPLSRDRSSSTIPLISKQQHEVAEEESIPMTPTPSIKSVTPSLADSQEQEQQHSEVRRSRKRGIVLAGRACGLFGPENILRRLFARILLWRWLEPFMMFVIALHCAVLLAVGWGNNPDPQPPRYWGQTWDHLWVLMRIIVYGFLFSPKRDNSDDVQNPPPPLAFMRHSWNRMDLISVVCYYVDLGLTSAGEVLVEDTRRILVFKALSTLILLRLLLITNGNRIILQSLKKAGPLLVTRNPTALSVYNRLKGLFCATVFGQYCGGYMEDGIEKPYLLLDDTPGPWSKGFICEEGLVCKETENPSGGTISFDNIFSSMLIVIIIAGNQTWTEPMYNMMDSEYFIVCLYFIVSVIIMNYWLINLFVAVINEMFAKIREDSQHSAFTSSKKKPVLADAAEGWSIGQGTKKQKNNRVLLVEFVKLTKPFWTFLVIADLIVMGWKNNDMTVDQLAIIDRAELGFSIAFLLEIIIRFASSWPRWGTFFDSKSNKMDLFIAIVTCIIRIPPVHDNQPVYAWLTGFQVLRIYRVIVIFPRVRTLGLRVLGSVWGLFNLVFFIILATLFGAIMSFQLFEGLLNDSDENMRFFSIYNSFAALNQLFSGEDWTTVLYATMEAGAPSKTAAIHALLLVLWFMFSNFILVNMFIAVLMENFETAEEEKRQLQIDQYVRKTEHVVDSDPVASRWNIYRYFRPHPKGMEVKNMPANLVLHAKKNTMREFMNDDGIYLSEQHNDESHTTPDEFEDGPDENIKRFSRVRGFFGTLFHRPAQRPLPLNSSTRKSMNLDDRNPLDHFHTFYDTRKGAGHEQNSLRTMIQSSSASKDSSALELAEAYLYDAEERKILRQDFIAAHPTYDKSLYLFTPNNRFRRWCQMLVPPSRGERFFGTQPNLVASWIFFSIICCSVLTTVVLTIYNSPVYQLEHRNDPDHLRIFDYLDYTFTFIFTVEFIIKVIADGFFMTPNAYLLNGWNILDMFVLVSLYMSNFGDFSSSSGVERAFRAFKALRALRLINLLKPAREMFTVILVKGLPHIFDAMCLCLFLIIPFALYGQNLFQGLFYFCSDDSDDITIKSMCVYEGMQGTQEPMSDDTEVFRPRIWDNPYVYSFDSFWKGLLVLVEIASGEGWVDVLEVSMSIVGKDQVPQQDASQLTGIFFMVYNLVGSVLVISLFLGVVLENFSRRNGTAYLTVEQRRWLDLKKLLGRMRPAKRPKEIPTSPLRKWCFDLVIKKRGRFYKFMTVVITLNILFLCTEFDRDDEIPGWTTARTYVFFGFICIYWLEIIIKLLALGWKSFRRNLWNLYDLIVVSGSTITTIFQMGTNIQQISVEAQKLFMTALCFKLVQRSDSLNQLFTIIAQVASAYQILNVFLVWFVIMTTYSIMFMEIFGLTKYGSQATSEHVNFRSYANTMIMLVRFSTGEAWNTVMHDFTIEAPECVAAEDYLDSDCGSVSWAYFLFLSYNIISMYIFTAIFVAVVADNFSYVYQIASNFSLVNRDEMRKYPFYFELLFQKWERKAWADFDVDRSGYLDPRNYIGFWRQLVGVFRTRIYEPEHSYKNLSQQCALDERLVDPREGIYPIRVDLRALQKKLSEIDRATIHQRKQDLDMLYWEAALTEGSKGVSFNQMLLMIARRKLIIPENALLLEELLSNRKREEVVGTLIKIDRVKGMIETIAMRKKFLQHMQNKRQQAVDAERAFHNLPSIVVDQHRLSRPHNLMNLYSAPATPVTPTSGFRHDDNGSVISGDLRSPTFDRSHIDSYFFDPEPGSSRETNSHQGGPPDDSSEQRDVWQDMLQRELKD